jgi:hypothetical protein
MVRRYGIRDNALNSLRPVSKTGNLRLHSTSWGGIQTTDYRSHFTSILNDFHFILNEL